MTLVIIDGLFPVENSFCVAIFVWIKVNSVSAAAVSQRIAALQPLPASKPRQVRSVQKATGSFGLYLVVTLEDASMMASQVNIFLPTQNTRARTNVFPGLRCVMV